MENYDYARFGDLPLESVGEQVSDLQFEEASDQAVALVQEDRAESAARDRMNSIKNAVVAYGWAMAFGLVAAFVLWAKWVNA